MTINQLSIIGLGKIGTSIAKAMRKTQFCKSIIAFDTNPKKITKALQLKIIDHCKNDANSAIKNADLAIIAVPICEYNNLFKQIKHALKKETVLTDVANVKMSTLKIVEGFLGEFYPNFIAGHPILGHNSKETIATTPELFANHPIILTPTSTTNLIAKNLVKKFWISMGAEVEEMSPEDHDEMLAVTNHIPQILAFTYLNSIDTHKNSANLIKFLNGELKDLTDSATIHPKIWKDTYLANRTAILEELEHFQKNLHSFKKLLESENAEQILDSFIKAKKIGDAL